MRNSKKQNKTEKLNWAEKCSMLYLKTWDQGDMGPQDPPGSAPEMVSLEWVLLQGVFIEVLSESCYSGLVAC